MTGTDMLGRDFPSDHAPQDGIAHLNLSLSLNSTANLYISCLSPPRRPPLASGRGDNARFHLSNVASSAQSCVKNCDAMTL